MCQTDFFLLLLMFYSVQKDNLYKINLDIYHYMEVKQGKSYIQY